MKLYFARPMRCLGGAALVLAAGCSSLPEEYRPIIDSLHTPEMEAAIKAARESPPGRR